MFDRRKDSDAEVGRRAHVVRVVKISRIGQPRERNVGTSFAEEGVWIRGEARLPHAEGAQVSAALEPDLAEVGVEILERGTRPGEQVETVVGVVRVDDRQMTEYRGLPLERRSRLARGHMARDTGVRVVVPAETAP